MLLFLNRLVQADAMGLVKAFQVPVVDHGVAGASLGHRTIVAEVPMPSQDQKHACFVQEGRAG